MPERGLAKITLAMKRQVGLKTIVGTIDPYPIQAKVIKTATNGWRKTSFTDGKKQLSG